MNSIHLWEFILKNLENNTNVILLTVLKNTGSSPGKPTFKMAVNHNKELIGTIGGGLIEYNLVEKAFEYLKQKKLINEIIELFHTNTAGVKSSGMICSGSQITSLTSITPENKNIINEIIYSIKDSKPVVLQLTQNGLSLPDEKLNNEFEFTYVSENNWTYKEVLGFKNTIYILGGGHVGKALARVMSTLNFNIIIIDNRDNEVIKNCEYANQVLIIDYNEIEKYIQENDNSYVAILTHTHNDDFLLTRLLIKRKLKYIGLMGSRAKIKTLINELKAEGIEEKFINKLYAPIGLEINSNTPEEIAISIAAQIIKIKNNG